jgi:hypothetical protein
MVGGRYNIPEHIRAPGLSLVEDDRGSKFEVTVHAKSRRQGTELSLEDR